MSMTYSPLERHFFYIKTGVCRGKPIFLIFDPKHTLGCSNEYPQPMFCAKIRKILKTIIILLKIFQLRQNLHGIWTIGTESKGLAFQ